VKDLIWLELQANMADRSLEQQDKFLFAARQNIAELLREIMTYRFNRKFYRNDSVISARTADSGVSSMASSTEAANLSELNEFCPQTAGESLLKSSETYKSIPVNFALSS
jgi:hypothetical protein